METSLINPSWLVLEDFKPLWQTVIKEVNIDILINSFLEYPGRQVYIKTSEDKVKFLDLIFQENLSIINDYYAGSSINLPTSQQLKILFLKSVARESYFAEKLTIKEICAETRLSQNTIYIGLKKYVNGQKLRERVCT